MKLPFAPTALSFAGGCLAGLIFKVYPFYIKPFLPLFLFLGWFLFYKKYYKLVFVFLVVSFFICGYIASWERKDKWEENPLRYLSSHDYMDFYGKITRAPERVKGGTNIYMKVKRASIGGKERNFEGKLKLFVIKTDSPIPEILPGDHVWVSAELSEKARYSNPVSKVDMNLMIKGIHRTGKIKSPYLIRLVKRTSDLSIQRGLAKIKIFVCERIDSAIKGQEREFLKGALLGERGNIEDSLIEGLQRTGLYHILAISGLHIGVISFVLFKILTLFRIPERKGYLILIFLLIFYALFLELKPPIVRASSVIILFMISKLIWKDYYFLNAISFSAFLLLLFNPHFIIDPGFLLSYSAVFFIAIYTESIYKILPLPSLGVSILNHFFKKLNGLTAISISATFGTLPIIALFFNRVVFASIFLNIIVIPLFIVFVFIAIPWFLVLIILPQFASFISVFIKVPILAIIWISKIPLPQILSFRVPTPDLFVFSLYIFSLFLIPFTKNWRKAVLTLIFLVSLILICVHPFPPVSKDFKITFLDIGPGDSILIEFPGKTKMLIDGGGGIGDYDVGEHIISPFLWSKGIKEIDYLLLSHAHPDHISGLF